MVLAGGCVAGTLYKMGAGSVVSFSAFIGLIVGSTIYAEFHAVWKVAASSTALFSGNITLAQVIGEPQGVVVTTVIACLAGMIGCWWRSDKLVRNSAASGYLQPWKASLILAVLVVVSVVVIGVPLGITTSYAKLGVALENVFVPEYVAGLPYFAVQPLSYANTLLGIVYRGGPGPNIDSIALIQFPLIGGIVAGGFLSVWLLKEFRIYFRIPPAQYVSGLLGGILMGLAARMAPSCNIWHLLGGIPVLAVQSILFALGLFPGAWLGTRLLTQFVLKDT